MKSLLFLSVLILICLKIDAQKLFLGNADLKIIKTNAGDTAHNKLYLNLPNAYSFNSSQGKLLYETKKGKVYALPPDNMLCLVPEYHSKMGVKSSNGAHVETMPNPLPKIEMIPKH